MTILDQIIADKAKEVAQRKQITRIADLEKTAGFVRTCRSLKQSLLQSESGIIAEFKRKSPSKGWIHADASVQEITQGYSLNGAAGISILTDFPYFGGTPHDLISARPHIACPVLRKDFMIDEYQLFEAKSYGADVVLLIAAALTIPQCKQLAQRAQSLGLETLLEVHNAEELGHINEYIDLVGVNNRNLKTFEVSTAISAELAEQIPAECVKISESGISNVQTVQELRTLGYKGFLMGENFMKETNPAGALQQFISEL
jgi:indole-3-glycerol phosphate synthase